MEADDDGSRSARQKNVALADRADTAMDDFNGNFVVGQLAECVGESFRRG